MSDGAGTRIKIGNGERERVGTDIDGSGLFQNGGGVREGVVNVDNDGGGHVESAGRGWIIC